MYKQTIEPKESMACEVMTIEGKATAEKRTNCLHGDILETVLSHSSTVDLVAASYVSITWQRAVFSSLRLSPRVWPWLLLHAQSRRNPSQVTVRAYDPHSHVWIDIPSSSSSSSSSSPAIRSSNSGLLYTLTSSKLAFSTDPLGATWDEVYAPRVCRRDPIVAAVGPHVVVAGGTWEFEDDPFAVEVYEVAAAAKSRRSERCEPMPDAFRGSASSTWLSVAVSDRKMHVIEKNTGLFCSFDPETKKWGPVAELRPDPLIFHSSIGYSSGADKLVLVGMTGDASNVSGLRLWEVNCDTLEYEDIGSMPPEILKRLSGEVSSSTNPLTSIVVCMARDFAYIYNPSSDLEPEEVYICDMSAGGGTCKWGSIQVPAAIIDRRMTMDRHLVFTCSVVGMDDLSRVFRPTSGSQIC